MGLPKRIAAVADYIPTLTNDARVDALRNQHVVVTAGVSGNRLVAVEA